MFPYCSGGCLKDLSTLVVPSVWVSKVVLFYECPEGSLERISYLCSRESYFWSWIQTPQCPTTLPTSVKFCMFKFLLEEFCKESHTCLPPAPRSRGNKGAWIFWCFEIVSLLTHKKHPLNTFFLFKETRLRGWRLSNQHLWKHMEFGLEERMICLLIF